MHSHLHYCKDYFTFSRHQTREIKIGQVTGGGNNPIHIQTILTSSPSHTDECVEEIISLSEMGCDILRIPIHNIEQAKNLQSIVLKLESLNCFTPLAADLYCNEEASFEAIKWAEGIRVNPIYFHGNESTIHANFQTLVYACKKYNRAILISSAHGCQPDSIINQFGNTPLAMCESVIKFAEIAREADFHNIAFALNASNPKIYIEANRLLVALLTMKGPDWNYPIHLSSIEKSSAKHHEIRSAIAIGSLLADGIGDTVNGIITINDVKKIQLSMAIIHSIQTSHPPKDDPKAQHGTLNYNPYAYARRQSHEMEIQGYRLGATNPIRVFSTQKIYNELKPISSQLGNHQPEIVLEECDIISVDPYDTKAVMEINAIESPQLVTVADGTHDVADIHAFRLLACKLASHHPILLKDTLRPPSQDTTDSQYNQIKASVNIGLLLSDGIGDAILVQGELDAEKNIHLAYNILQASGSRHFHTEYITCPSCAHTQVNIHDITKKIQSATAHLQGIKIAILGCIVNGINELTDADYSYIGSANERVTLYRKKHAVQFNIPEKEALDTLIKIIQDDGKWINPPSTS